MAGIWGKPFNRLAMTKGLLQGPQQNGLGLLSENALRQIGKDNRYSIVPESVPITNRLQGFGELGGIPRPDGGISTELGITVTDPRLNEGRPTNIPALVEGQQDIWNLINGMGLNRQQQEIAIERALERMQGPIGIQWPSYESIDEAVAAAQRHSQSKNRYSK